ncbi:MAG: hypothetical protein FRX48_02225 [Lasallia pustulata]|uniref:Uncharacterized protein n=1 Tax=Lasallia pustulata TaxID=136370 RepID=A0A5M8PW07_9LECA|nr:MAG: hypothetical protein FRX48_02225 [Lasallia pustulata]
MLAGTKQAAPDSFEVVKKQRKPKPISEYAGQSTSYKGCAARQMFLRLSEVLLLLLSHNPWYSNVGLPAYTFHREIM